MLLLAIETSCDETSAAIARGPTDHGPADRGVDLLANVVASQDDLHAHFGGIVPEVASRRHIEMIIPVTREAMQRASATWDDIEAIAVTNGPGLLGSLVVGVAAAKALAQARGIPLVGVHHLEAHIYSAAVGQPLPFPLLALIASGGHSHLVLMPDHGDYQVLGRTRDDAPGEAFDKGARLLGLPYPGGPQLAALADSFTGRIEPLPRAHLPDSRDFSFSGVKTALARAVRAEPLHDDRRAALAAAYQESIARSLTDRTLQVAEEIGNCTVLVVGGVARNSRLRALLTERAQSTGIPVHFPDPAFCTDNAAMVAAAGLYKLARVGADPPDLDCSPNPPLRSWHPGAEP